MENLIVEKIVNQIFNLPIELQLQIIQILNENIMSQPKDLNYKWNADIPEWQQIELERRIKNIEADKTKCFSWEEVEKDLNEIIENENLISI